MALGHEDVDEQVEPRDEKPSERAANEAREPLEVRVAGDKIEYAVNGTVVHTTPRSGATAKTDGIYGIRVNHLLEVQVDGLTATK